MNKIIEHKDDDGNIVFQIDKKQKKGKYFLIHADKQTQYLQSPVLLEGFDKLPSGFYKNGFGLTLAGSLLIQEISLRHGKKIKLTVNDGNSCKINLKGKVISLTLSGRLLGELGNVIRAIKRQRNAEMVAEAKRFLGNQFTQFKDLKEAQIGYVSGTLSTLLNSEQITNKLNSEDRLVLEEFIPNYLQSIPGTLRSKKKLKVIFDTLDAGKKIYLDKVLKEFKSKLKKAVQNENVWQKFLSEYILLLQYNYGEVLEKESVSLKGKFPDFMLVDPYGYLDIYEIKKPSTNLLKLDTSRNNHYWDIEVSKAIAQVENYIHQCQRHADILATDIRNSKGIDINIVRPRGYIIVGSRSQLNTPKMKDDFRILCDSLKNVDIILYDDLLDSLQTFVDKASN